MSIIERLNEKRSWLAREYGLYPTHWLLGPMEILELDNECGALRWPTNEGGHVTLFGGAPVIPKTTPGIDVGIPADAVARFAARI